MNNFKYLLQPLFRHPLNRDNKLEALTNFLILQLKIRMVNPNEIIVPFTQKSKFIVKKGRTGLTGNLYSGLHEFEDMMFLLHFLRNDDVFFDIGANAGSYSILANGHVGAKTVSFEPLPLTAELLTNNKAINGNSDSWKIEVLALGDKEDILWFTSDRDTMNQVVNESYRGNKIKVAVVPLDQYCDHHKIIPTLLKVDAEGFDENVIQGGKFILGNENAKALIIESDTQVVKDILLQSGFGPFIYEPFSRRLTEGYNNGCNQIYIKDLEFVKKRIDSAEKVKIKGYSI